jgi:hypothetical protein
MRVAVAAMRMARMAVGMSMRVIVGVGMIVHAVIILPAYLMARSSGER